MIKYRLGNDGLPPIRQCAWRERLGFGNASGFGCELGQGYLFARPMALKQLLDEGEANPVGR